jgi:glycosyltransferase involved in cell wall biosynthesis
MVSFMLRAWRLGRTLPKLIVDSGKPDVVIGSSPHLLTPFAAYRVAHGFRVPFVMEVRDLWPQSIVDMGGLTTGHPITRALQALERFLYHRAERIISLFPQAHEYMSRCGVPHEKIVWIPNGVDLSRFDAPSVKGTPGESFRIAYLGAHGRANALDVLIRAAKIVEERGYPEIRFILMGAGPEKPRLMALARELGLVNLEFRKPVPRSEVPDVLHEADATVCVLHDIPLYRYGISVNKLFDYLAAGKPLILAGSPSNNLVEEADCGLTCPSGNPHALAGSVIQLYQMAPEEREAMGRRGRHYVEKLHDMTKLAERLEQTLTDALGCYRSPHPARR